MSNMDERTSMDERPSHDDKKREKQEEKTAKKRDSTIQKQAALEKEKPSRVKLRNGVAIASAVTVRACLFPGNRLMLASDLLPSVERKLGNTLLEIIRKKRRLQQRKKSQKKHQLNFWAQAKKSVQKIYILDARRSDEYEASHIPTAHNYHYTMSMKLPEEIQNLDRDTPVVTYCAVGLRSGAFARRLRHEGFTQVAVLKGGYYRWANLGYPIVSGSGNRGYLVKTVKSQHLIASILLRQELKLVEVSNKRMLKKRYMVRRHAARLKRRQYSMTLHKVHVNFRTFQAKAAVVPPAASAESSSLPSIPQTSARGALADSMPTPAIPGPNLNLSDSTPHSISAQFTPSPSAPRPSLDLDARDKLLVEVTPVEESTDLSKAGSLKVTGDSVIMPAQMVQSL